MDKKAFTRHEGTVYAVFRIVAGAMFACHGLQKIFGLLGGHRAAFGTQIWVGGIIELVGGTLIALGLFTRPAAFIAAGTMAVAYFQFHWKLALDHEKWLPIINKGELAALYCFVFLYICARGAGLLSLDRRLGRG
jgi:putative oxidoreductase